MSDKPEPSIRLVMCLSLVLWLLVLSTLFIAALDDHELFVTFPLLVVFGFPICSRVVARAFMR